MLHLVRHGEVDNPLGLVYADLPGFDLSETGRSQAAGAAAALAGRPIHAVWSSPLVRAVRTAEAIADVHRLPVRVDDDLVEWRLLTRWAGTPWAELPTRFPGELEAYLAHPDDLPFSPEPLARLAERVAGVARRVVADATEAVIVGHQDPLAAAERRLTGASFVAFHDGKPDHAEIRSFQVGTPWRRT